jgi:hypothetical protein
LENAREPLLSLWNPPRVVLPNHLFRIADQLSDISRNNPVLQQDSDEGVAETVGVWSLFPLPTQRPNLVQFPPPEISYGFDSRRPTRGHEGTVATFLFKTPQAMNEFIWRFCSAM